MSLHFRDARPADAATVEAAEKRLNVVLPQEYKEMLTSVSNGGYVEPMGFRSNLDVGVDAVLGVARGDDLDLEATIGVCALDQRLPDGVIPIADAGCGNLVCLSTRQSDFGSVWFWDHEHEGHAESTSLIAGNLKEFVSGLAPMDEFEIPHDPNAKVWIDPDFRP